MHSVQLWNWQSAQLQLALVLCVVVAETTESWLGHAPTAPVIDTKLKVRNNAAIEKYASAVECKNQIDHHTTYSRQVLLQNLKYMY